MWNMFPAEMLGPPRSFGLGIHDFVPVNGRRRPWWFSALRDDPKIEKRFLPEPAIDRDYSSWGNTGCDQFFFHFSDGIERKSTLTFSPRVGDQIKVVLRLGKKRSERTEVLRHRFRREFTEFSELHSRGDDLHCGRRLQGRAFRSESANPKLRL